MFAPISEILEDLRAGKMIILVDDEDRENEGDLVIAAEKVTPEAINFMAKYGRGLICLALTPERIDELRLPPMTTDNRSRFGTAFHVSIEAASGVTTGISAFDRAHTILTAINPATKPQDLVQPGHVFPLRAREGGVLVRAGQTEGSVDLTRLAGLYPAAVICEILADDGTMARLPQLEEFAARHGLKICSVESIIQYRRLHEKLVRRSAETLLPLEVGDFRLIVYETLIDDNHHLALVMGEIDPERDVLVRVHSECLTGDVFGSLRCDCGNQLRRALRMIAEAGCGVLVYMRQEGRGIGLVNKIKAYALQDKGLDTVEANVHLGFDPDPREYGLGAQILADLGVKRMRLITNNPSKRVGLEAYGLEITERVPLVIPPNERNKRYMQTKKEKLGHLI
ncbi:MAG TPA: bifunctional 3,4-dihydroxy-2-butanone-4-phosphate synthase/GTP cyclohydrolase II [Candidatus Hydrogenedentes bacterium]|nr:bifunctional 3,4-dihydroxy-2-butanone-4-phosphate synthase/GTP cyclohydrolase II [Candidatus Hydrogenedentota bacterium]HOL78261.1 bifunctional 3,4-dihydroxy-2-butanone-4-phosphate synthase/GTP cyclohydrolase II [Candidatus Hydrogenedentota bacterium]HPO85378.1 bifunctional 3,4-dihydroxy-2-butanone-4-phosphate synthase/GTP cyclohydrolase II [Candidatus Hydrogenedentota bacterium]